METSLKVDSCSPLSDGRAAQKVMIIVSQFWRRPVVGCSSLELPSPGSCVVLLTQQGAEARVYFESVHSCLFCCCQSVVSSMLSSGCPRVLSPCQTHKSAAAPRSSHTHLNGWEVCKYL